MQFLGAMLKTTEWSRFISKANHSASQSALQVYAPIINAKEIEVDQFSEDLQYLLELTSKRDVFFIIGDWNAKVGNQVEV